MNTSSKTAKTGETANISLPFDFAVINANIGVKAVDYICDNL